MNKTLFLNGANGAVPMKVLDGQPLTHKIYWSFDTVSAAVEQTADDFQNFLKNEYLGSNHYLGDEGYVFDPRSRCLSDVFLHVPEDNFDGENILRKITNSLTIRGRLYLTEDNHKFSAISVANRKYLMRDGRFLLCVSLDEFSDEKDDFFCLAIHERLTMVFVNDHYKGFVLSDPFRSLVRFAGFDDKKIEADRLVDLSGYTGEFLRYFDTMDLDGWDKIENQDLEIKLKLHSIKEGLAAANLSIEPLYSLWEQCDRLLREYYDEVV